MKTTLVSISLLFSFSLFANNSDITNIEKGDFVEIKEGTKAAQFTCKGFVEAKSGKDFVKVNGFFVRVSDIKKVDRFKGSPVAQVKPRKARKSPYVGVINL